MSTIIFLSSSINIYAENVDIDNLDNQKSSDVKPKIDVNYLGTTPSEIVEGQEFEVSYEIIPHPFQNNQSKPKEIVLVLDASGSMSEITTCSHGQSNNHYIYRNNEVEEVCSDVKTDYCVTHKKTGNHWTGWQYCNENRITYCTKHETSDNHEYCQEERTRLGQLKLAAKSFIEKMREVNNLSLGIVVYSSEATINPGSVNGTKTVTTTNGSRHSVPNYISLSNTNFLDINDDRLFDMIDNLKASGGTNTGEGLRKAEYLLEQGDSNANKTIILMSDGLPTFYSTYKESNNKYGEYTNIDNSTPLISGPGNGTSTDSTNYAKTIGSKIKANNPNIFSIGYGLGSSTSEGNRTLQDIHRSMGGVVNLNNPEDPQNTFFATNDGAINSIFNKIADVLIQSYTINDASLNLNLSDSITVVDGLDSITSNGQTKKLDPIIYNLGENNWYTSERQIITFKVKATNTGNMQLYKTDGTFTYKDINGIDIEVPIKNQSININPYIPSEAEKLKFEFKTMPTNYLIGDTVNGKATYIHSGTKTVTFKNAKFNEIILPSNIVLEDSTISELNFGQVSSTTTKDINFKINDLEEININNPIQYSLQGNYSYTITNKYGNNTQESGTSSTAINVKRGQVKVKVLDQVGNDISNLSKVSISGKYLQENEGEFKDGYILYNTISSGNYKLTIKELPEGCEPKEGQNTGNVIVSYDNNIAEYIFHVNGIYEEPITSDIGVELIEATPNPTYVGSEVNVTYEITPKDFTIEGNSNDIGMIDEAIFVVDLSSVMNRGNIMSQLINNIHNVILQSSKIKDSDIKFGVVGYNSEANFPDNQYYKLFNKNERNQFNDNVVKQMSASNNISDRNIISGIKKADELLQKTSDPGVNQAIILLTGDSVSNIDANYIKEIKSRGYKVISVDLSDKSNSNINETPATYMGDESLKNLHLSLGGNESDFIISRPDGGNFNYINKDLEKVVEALVVSNNKGYIKDNVKINLNLGDKFEFIDSNKYKNIKSTSVSGHDVALNLKDIPYEFKDGKYQSDKFRITFKVKPKLEGENISFEDATISFDDIDNRLITKDIAKPYITVNGTLMTDIIHGIYEGMINGNPMITEEAKTMPYGSSVPFAATFDIYNKETELTLQIDSRLSFISDIKVYKIRNGSTLQLLSNEKVPGDSKSYTVNIDNRYSVNNTDKILVIYNVILPKNISTTEKQYTNNIFVYDSNKEVVVKAKFKIFDLF